jgi:hypothetical protein
MESVDASRLWNRRTTDELLRYALQKFACAHYLHVGEHFQAAGHCIWIAQTGLVFRESGSSPTRSTSG